MDPLKSSILASSQGGWTQSPASPSATSLRISKRDAESIAPSLASLLPKNANHSGVTRRSSSSYNHMRNHTLVSKSVFKSPNGDRMHQSQRHTIKSESGTIGLGVWHERAVQAKLLDVTDRMRQPT
ncbi:hypothetical protein FRC03_011065 [Tulasnella sp. 419]|nr:hypothetical protein FRC03_011065 [Tulasnella sp. 419]